MGDEIVTLYVGPTRKKFIVHKNLICASSDFFKKAFTGNFLEGQESTINLNEDNPDAVSLFIHWLYSSAIPIGNSEMYLHSLYNLYFFADKICLSILKDTVMDKIQDMSLEHNLLDQLVDPALFGKVLKVLPTQDKGLRKFCKDILVQVFSDRASRFPDDYEKSDKDDDDNDNDEDEDEDEKKVVYLRRADVKTLHEICKDELEFFRSIIDGLSYDMQMRIIGNWDENQIESDEVEDERIETVKCLTRDEDDPGDRCWYRCHKKSFDCRAKPDAEFPSVEKE